MSVKFYMTAILFVVFDIEVVFIYPWATLFKGLGWSGFATMLGFISALIVALRFNWLLCCFGRISILTTAPRWDRVAAWRNQL